MYNLFHNISHSLYSDTVIGLELRNAAIVKNYSRNTKGQSCLHGLSLLAIEASWVKIIDTGKLTDHLADIKVSKVDVRD